MPKFQTLKVAPATSTSEAILETWRRVIDRLGIPLTAGIGVESNAEALFVRARAGLRAGALDAADSQLVGLLRVAPTFAAALEDHGEVLDMTGRSDLARASYEAARRSRGQIRRGLPDRHFAVRNRDNAIAEIVAYTKVLAAGPAKRRAHSYVGRGNAYLASGRPKLALLDYNRALRTQPDLPGALALKGEALAALGRYGRALQAFDRAISLLPDNAEFRGSRAIALLASGRLEAADADWRRQLELLPQQPAAARACVSLRLADYEAALTELQRALEAEPADPYWHLYRMTVLKRLGRASATAGPALDRWPGPLLALHQGQLTADQALARADTAARRGEALFQLAVEASRHDRDPAQRLWTQVIGLARPDTVEYAAARHELIRPGA